MKAKLASILGVTLALTLQLPAQAVSWKMLAECHFIGVDGKQQIDDTCRVEGGSGQGMTTFFISWKDGVKTKVQGNFARNENYTVDGQPAVMKQVNAVTILRTYSGNVIILHKIRELR